MMGLMLLARRFVAGETAAEALPKVKALNRQGIRATLDILGENVASQAAAHQAADGYLELLDRIRERGVDANVSIKLTQMGLDLGDDFCFENVMRIVEKAAAHRNFVRIDMEGSTYTQRTLDLFRRVFETHRNVGIVIQAMLRRSAQDVRELLPTGARIRLCKGAYKEPPDVAHQRMEDIRRSYRQLLERLLTSGAYPAVATHDEALIRWTLERCRTDGFRPEAFEFQMLYGLRRQRQRELAAAGFNIRCYVPFGTHWFPYFWRRLRERKENVFFVLRHLFSNS